MLIEDLQKKNLIKPPHWLNTNTVYLTLTGSVTYGVSSASSDVDVLGVAIPTKEQVFPHLAGEIEGFGRQKQRFEQFLQHRIDDKEERKVYDLTVFNIVKYFNLLMECNPNIVDSVWTPQNCVIHSTKIGNMIRDNKKIFLHKGLWPKFKGYSYSQQAKMSNKEVNVEETIKFEKEYCVPHNTKFKEIEDEIASRRAGNPAKNLSNLSDTLLEEYRNIFSDGMHKSSSRFELVKEMGYDVKFATHTIRLLLEAEQLLSTGELNLQRDKEYLKTIRAGKFSIEEIRQTASDKEKFLESLYEKSTLPWGPDENKIKKLLLDCLEEHYGNLSGCIVRQDAALEAISKVEDILKEFRMNNKI